MALKTWIWLGVIVGSTLATFLGQWIGISALSFNGILISTGGGLLGIWLGYRIGKSY